jgi:rhodanese-related sulfurtransferase/transcriptional regulator with XRE-family HTH domain
MIHTLTPREAETLLGGGDIQVIDVREPDEWETGHLPGAHLVPLGELRDDPRRYLGRDKVLFVCEKGARSLSAAKLFEQLGLSAVYSLEGGTRAWADGGFPIEVPAPPPGKDVSPGARGPDAAAEAATPSSISPNPEEPALDTIVGTNLREMRAQRGLTLDAMARLTGLGRALLGQIELGRSSPSVSVVWKIARAFDVPFSALLATPTSVATRVLRKKQAKRLVSADGRFSSRALFPLGQQDRVEFYEVRLSGHSREDAEAHQAGTRENLIVTAGRLELTVAGQRFDLDEGDAIVFGADVPHVYNNPGAEECCMCLVMIYARG